MDIALSDAAGRCEVLAWAASGAMALTGWPDGPPALSPAPSFGLVSAVCAQFAGETGRTGRTVAADPAELLAGRAALTGLTRQGQVSAGGSSRLLRTADGWCAITLSRAADTSAVPAIIGRLALEGAGSPGPVTGFPGGWPAQPPPGGGSDRGGQAAAWAGLQTAARVTPAAALAAAAQLLGVPAAALPAPPPAPLADGQLAGPAPVWPPWRRSRIAARSPGAGLAGALVVDLSSMWAGPLCARLLGLAGAHVVKVESPARPDGARAGDRGFYNWLHAGHRSVAADFRTETGRSVLASLLLAADVVIESSRPRALANLGLAPGRITHRAGQVWLAITGYGAHEPDQVAFGDDAAVAGGLVGWTAGDGHAGRTGPVFCADAVADPLSGVCGALAVATSLASGGGELIDLSMRSAAASFAAAPPGCPGPHHIGPDQAVVSCGRLGAEQAVLAPRRPRLAGPAASLGADTAAVLAGLGSC